MRKFSIVTRMAIFVAFLGVLGVVVTPAANAAPAAADSAASHSNASNTMASCWSQTDISVPESSSGVATRLWVPYGGRVTISPDQDSRIWAGVAFTQPNGPRGWVDLAGPNFPLRDRPVFSLIARISNNYPPNYYYAGRYRTFDNWQNPGWVILRTNDDAPGNGSGAFIADVTVCS
jgi:hypothetical protein